MKLNIFHEHVMEACAQRSMTEKAVLEKAREAGIDGLECEWQRLRVPREKVALFQDCGMTVRSIYRSFDMGHKTLAETAGEYRQLFDIAAAFGTDKVLCVPGFVQPQDDPEEIRRRMNDHLFAMAEEGRAYRITVTLEDFDNSLSPCSTMDGLRRFFEAVPALRFNFDTGNFAYSAEDAQEAFHLLSDKIVHVHLKDRTRDAAYANSEDDNWQNDVTGRRMYPVAVGDGYVGIDKLLEQLKGIGYNGSLSLEHFGAADQLEAILRSAQNVRRILQSL